MSETTPQALEPIKTALAMGDYPLARARRLELYRELVEEMAGVMSDPLRFIDGPPVGYLRRVTKLVESVDTLAIPDER
jgi:hypothetical protein